MKNKRVLLGMSGGVDSSVSAILLQEQGYEVVGITMKLFENNDIKCADPSKDAKEVCDKLKIEHHTIDLTDEFKKRVIDDFIKKYQEAKTPNPCIECNRYLKFGAMYEQAKILNCDYIATGHYAKTEYSNEYNKTVLKKSDSIKKDQSYVLYNIPKEILDKVIFPLANFNTKDEIRQIAQNHGLTIANKPDSEDICFIPDNDYVGFLQRHGKIKLQPGKFVNKTGKVFGKHEGIVKYTIGQRRGLGISYKEPLYVIGIDKKQNEVILGVEKEIYTKELYANELNFLLFDNLKEEMQVKAKIRYLAKEAEARLIPIDNDTVKVVFEEEQRAVTPGQSVVFYIDDVVLGGGKII